LELVVDRDVRPEQPEYDEAPQMSDDIWQLAESCWVKTPQSRPIASALCDAIKQLLEDERVDKLRNAREHAGELLSQTQYEEAKPLCKGTSGGDEKTLGKQNPATWVSGVGERDALTSLNKSAQELFNRVKYNESEPLFRQVLEGRERVLGREHPDTLNSLNDLANALRKQDKHTESEPCFRRVLEGRERVLGREHPDTLTALNDLGNALYSQHKYDQAETFFRRALEGRERVLGRDHPDTSASRDRLVGMYTESSDKRSRVGRGSRGKKIRNYLS
jgi:tetratricopeptide (TPR) repeat protein